MKTAAKVIIDAGVEPAMNVRLATISVGAYLIASNLGSSTPLRKAESWQRQGKRRAPRKR